MNAAPAAIPVRCMQAVRRSIIDIPLDNELYFFKVFKYCLAFFIVNKVQLLETMKSIILSIFLIFINYECNSQLINHGSYSIAAFCSDGIVIGVDSRASWDTIRNSNPNLSNKINKTPLAYNDYVNKITTLNNFIVSHISYGFIGKYSVEYYLDKYIKSKSITNDMSLFIHGFYTYIEINYPEVLGHIRQVKFMVIGYIDGLPSLSFNDVNTDSVFTGSDRENTGGYLTSDSLSNFDKVYSRSFTCKKMAKIITNEIKEIADRNGMNNVIGGAIRVIKISPTGVISWVQNKTKSINWLTLKDFYSDYKSGKIKVNFLIESNRSLWEKIISASIY